MNTSTRANAASDHQPIQARLQMARMSRGRTANRVQTDQGLAWRIQLSPLSPNRLATLRSEVPLDLPVRSGVEGAAGVLIWGPPADGVALVPACARRRVLVSV
jgi:hypothetical protein